MDSQKKWINNSDKTCSVIAKLVLIYITVSQNHQETCSSLRLPKGFHFSPPACQQGLCFYLRFSHFSFIHKAEVSNVSGYTCCSCQHSGWNWVRARCLRCSGDAARLGPKKKAFWLQPHNQHHMVRTPTHKNSNPVRPVWLVSLACKWPLEICTVATHGKVEHQSYAGFSFVYLRSAYGYIVRFILIQLPKLSRISFERLN